MIYKENKQYRLPDYDYRPEGGHFVTICTKGRGIYFGDVVNGSTKLSKIGKVAI